MDQDESDVERGEGGGAPVEVSYDAAIYKQRNRIERMFGRLKDWLRIAMRYD